jgi:hypothetical protein
LELLFCRRCCQQLSLLLSAWPGVLLSIAAYAPSCAVAADAGGVVLHAFTPAAEHELHGAVLAGSMPQP